jgi:hypothetical protein
MFDDDLKALWNRGGREATMSYAEIERLLQPTARRAHRSLAVMTYTYAAMLGATVVLALANLPGYWQNAVMVAVVGAIGIVSAALVVATVGLMRRLRAIDRADQPLVEAVNARLAFAERGYQAWLLMASATPWLLSLVIVMLIDNEGGVYRVNRPIEFAVVKAAMFAIVYTSLRVSTAATVRELRAVARDLRAESLEATPELAEARRRSRVWMAAGVVLLTLAVVAGFWMWLGAR